jgi:hypothetical protein
MARNLRTVVDADGTGTKPRRRRAGRLTVAVRGGERELLVVIRRQLAQRLDSGDYPAHAMTQLIRQLRDVDREIRMIDARAAEVAEAEAYDEQCTADDTPWDPQAI